MSGIMRQGYLDRKKSAAKVKCVLQQNVDVRKANKADARKNRDEA